MVFNIFLKKTLIVQNFILEINWVLKILVIVFSTDVFLNIKYEKNYKLELKKYLKN